MPTAADSWPLVAEFYFDYEVEQGSVGDGQLEDYPAAAVEGASRLFAAVQGQAGWCNPNVTTKTAFALEIF